MVPHRAHPSVGRRRFVYFAPPTNHHCRPHVMLSLRDSLPWRHMLMPIVALLLGQRHPSLLNQSRRRRPRVQRCRRRQPRSRRLSDQLCKDFRRRCREGRRTPLLPSRPAHQRCQRQCQHAPQCGRRYQRLRQDRWLWLDFLCQEDHHQLRSNSRSSPTSRPQQ